MSEQAQGPSIELLNAGRVFRIYALGDDVCFDVEADEGDQCTYRGPSGFRIRLQTTLTLEEAIRLAARLADAIAEAGGL